MGVLGPMLLGRKSTTASTTNQQHDAKWKSEMQQNLNKERERRMKMEKDVNRMQKVVDLLVSQQQLLCCPTYWWLFYLMLEAEVSCDFATCGTISFLLLLFCKFEFAGAIFRISQESIKEFLNSKDIKKTPYKY